MEPDHFCVRVRVVSCTVVYIDPIRGLLERDWTLFYNRRLMSTHYQLSIEAKFAFLRHLRHLLRETSYLPDPAARAYYHHHILRRFREYRPRTPNPLPPWPIQQKWIKDAVDEARCLRNCRYKTSVLYRAGIGDEPALMSVLSDTYGRSGRRRHELLRPYIGPDNATNVETITAEDILQNEIPNRIQVSVAAKLLAKTQLEQRDVIGPKRLKDWRKFDKLLGPVLPEKNAWGRPMPLKRVRNATRKTFNSFYEKLLPPVPQEEWERLRDLAIGIIPFQGPVQRRARLRGCPELPQVMERQIHTLSARFMRRLWAKIFAHTSYMIWNPVAGKWNIVWGNMDKISSKLAVANSQEVDGSRTRGG